MPCTCPVSSRWSRPGCTPVGGPHIPKLLEKVADAAPRRPRAVLARHELRSGPILPLDAGAVVAARQPATNNFGLLRHWAAEGRNHSGVIFADSNTVRPKSPAAVGAAVAVLAAEIGNASAVNMIRFLRPA